MFPEFDVFFFHFVYNCRSVIAAEGSLLFLTMCYSAFEFPANSFINLKRISILCRSSFCQQL